MSAMVSAGPGRPATGVRFCIGFLLVSMLAGRASALAGVVPEPRFSHARGFYVEPFRLTITNPDPQTLCRYTTDGSEPSAQTGYVYMGPIRIEKTTCIRALAFGSDGNASGVVTHTYLLGVSQAVQSLPVLSLSGDERDVFYMPDGICAIRGGQYTGNYVSWRPVHDGDYNIPLEHGRAFERAISAEMILADNSPGFQVDCGIRVNGSTYTRSRYRTNSKFSFRLYFRSDYGPARLDYPLIPQAAVGSLDRVVLRAGQSDAANPFIKDELGRRLQRDMSEIACMGSFVNLFVNGRYKGYYNPTERIDEKMFQGRFGPGLSWDVVTHWRPEDDDYQWQPGDPVDRAYRFDVRDGDPCDMNALLDYVLSHDLRIDEAYDEVERRLDIAQFVDYLILEGYLGHRDWPHNNWAAARARCDGDLGKWRFYAWDLEHCFYDSDVDTAFKTPSSGGNVQPVGILYQELLVNDRFKRCFADRLQRHFFNGGALTAEHVTDRFEELRTTMAGVLANMNTSIRDIWAPQRPAWVLASLRNNGLLAFEGPRLFVEGLAYRGRIVRAGDLLTLVNPHGSGTIFYTLNGSDPRLSAAAGDDEPPVEDFSGAERGRVIYEYWLDVPGSSLSALWDLPAFPGDPTGSQWLTCLESPERWADNYGARVYGYLYPEVTGDYTFWIASDDNGELHLSADANPDHAQRIAYVSGWTAAREWDKYASQQSDAVQLQAGRRYYIEAVHKEGGGGDHVGVAWQGPGLPRQVIDGSYLGPAVIDWTTPPPSDGLDGGQISPQAIAYSGQQIILGRRTVVKARILDEGHWSGLTEMAFSTGAFDVLNEVMSDNVATIVDPDEGGELPDWIELFNPSAAAIDLSGLYVTDDLARPMKHRLDAGTVIEPGGFLLLWADDDMEQGPRHLPFKLDRDGEVVGIYDARLAQWVDLVSVPALPADHSWSRVPGDAGSWTTDPTPSPGGANNR